MREYIKIVNQVVLTVKKHGYKNKLKAYLYSEERKNFESVNDYPITKSLSASGRKLTMSLSVSVSKLGCFVDLFAIEENLVLV